MKGLKMLVDNTEFIKKLMNQKMLTIKAEENVIRVFPPLVVKIMNWMKQLVRLKLFVRK